MQFKGLWLGDTFSLHTRLTSAFHVCTYLLMLCSAGGMMNIFYYFREDPTGNQTGG